MSFIVRALMGSAAKIDPYFKNVSLLLSGDGNNGAQNNTFLDSSINNLTITRNGNATQGSFSPYGSNWSNYFDGSGDYLTVPSNAAFAYGTGDFTVETWVYKATSGIMAVMDYSNSGGFGFLVNDTQIVAYQSVGAAFTFTFTLPLNTWAHVALVRTGGNLIGYVNGVLVGSLACTTNFTSPSDLNIGRNPGGNTYFWNGYISNLRIVKGTAVYTTAFTPSTSPLTAISGTSLLTCQSNRFRDASTNNFTITHNGNVKVTNFAPFAPAAAYSTSALGGSGYFDGTGDYLKSGSNSGFVYGTNDFTMEAWVYSLDTSSTQGVVSTRTDASSSSTQVFFGIASGQVLYYAGAAISGGTLVVNSWNHIACSRQSGTVRVFLNGVLVATGTDNASKTTTFGYIGAGGGDNSQLLLGGYISDARFVNGTAVYTANFTPPTTPLTAVSGTVMLCKFANAGILDSAMSYNLETLDNAQISTSTKKYGTGSMYFDGTNDYLLSSGPAVEWGWLHSGATDWTIECWVNPSNTSAMSITCTNTNSVGGAYGMVMGIGVMGSSGSIGGHFTRGVDGARMDWYTAGGLISSGTWTHVVVQFNRSTKNCEVYINGTSVSVTNQNVVGNSPTGGDGSAFAYASADIAPLHRLNIGRVAGSVSFGSYFNGYMDDLRITRGVRRYTSTFTPPTASFPTQ